MIRVAPAALVAAALLAPITAARAEVSVNASLGLSGSDTGNHQFGFPLSGGLGFAPEAVPIELNVGYLTTGRMRDWNGGPKSNFSVSVATFGYRQELDRSGRHRIDRKSTRLNSSHERLSRMPSSA